MRAGPCAVLAALSNLALLLAETNPPAVLAPEPSPPAAGLTLGRSGPQYQLKVARPLDLQVRWQRIAPVISVADRVGVRLEETRPLVTHLINLTVEQAGIYVAELGPLAGFHVSDVQGEALDDWKTIDDKLVVNFATRALGRRRLTVLLEHALAALPESITLHPLRVTGAARETAQIGVAPPAGVKIHTTEIVGAREIPAASLPLALTGSLGGLVVLWIAAALTLNRRKSA